MWINIKIKFLEDYIMGFWEAVGKCADKVSKSAEKLSGTPSLKEVEEGSSFCGECGASL